MREKTFHLLLTSIFLGSLMLMTAPKSNAADFAVGVYPPILQIQATAPSVITKDITVVNASSQQENLAIQLRLFTQSENNSGQATYPSHNIPRPDIALFQKIQILDSGTPIGAVTLAPKQKKTLTLRIALPKGEQAADYYFSVLFLSGKNIAADTNGSAITAGIATNILLSIGSKQNETTGILSEFSTPFFVQTGPVLFTVFVANTSDHFIAPTGHILISNMFGQLIGQVNLLSVNILQHTSRYIPSKETQLNKNGHPTVVWGEKILFGLYQARISVALSSQGPLFTKTIYFFAMPLDYLVGIFLAVVILSIVIARVRIKTKEL